MASITIEARKVARKSPIRVDTSLVGTVSGVEAVTVFLPSSKARLSVGKLGYKSNIITVEDGQTVRVSSNFLNRLIAIAPLLLYLFGGHGFESRTDYILWRITQVRLKRTVLKTVWRVKAWVGSNRTSSL